MRRSLLVGAAGAALLNAVGATRHVSPARRIGIVTYSYWQRYLGRLTSGKHPRFANTLEFIDHAMTLGVHAVQAPVEGWSAHLADEVRGACESYGLAFEAIVELPRAEGDLGRFERELRLAKSAGAGVLRCAAGGRRYEVFRTRQQFLNWSAAAIQSIRRAEPMARGLDLRIAIENHKDFETQELLRVLRDLSSPHIGACVDTGNCLALLEDPLETVTALAPYAMTVHLKDIAARETAEGFEMAEVPLGEGLLPLPALLQTLRQANPEVRFHLEMITRDPISIPCLTPGYWTTFPEKPGTDLARTLALVRQTAAKKLPTVEGLSADAVLEMEQANVVRSLDYAVRRLGFDPLSPNRPSPQRGEP